MKIIHPFLFAFLLVNVGYGQTFNLDVQDNARIHGALDIFSGTDSSCVFIGVVPLLTSSQNTFIGADSGLKSGGSSFPNNKNTFLGYQSGRNNFNGSENVYLGAQSGRCTTGSGNIFIGAHSGFYNDCTLGLSYFYSNRLFIDNETTLNPLIYGEFDDDYVKINGKGDYASYLRVGTDEEDYPSTGEGLELVYDSNDSIGLIQAYNRDSDTWSNLFLGRGHVGINTLSPSYSLDVNGRIRGNEVYCSSTNACSDIRFKHSFSDIDQPLDLISHFKGYYHYWDQDAHPDWNFPPDRQIGFKAQEVQKLLPEVVSEMTDGMLAVDYAKIVPVLVEAIKEQQKIINNQENRLDQQESFLSDLSKRIIGLENKRLN